MASNARALPRDGRGVLIAWLMLAAAAAVFVVIPLIFINPGSVVLVAIVAAFAGLFEEQAVAQFRAWRTRSSKAFVYLAVLLILIALIAVIAGTDVLPGYAIAVPLVLCLFVFVRVFYIGLAGFVILPFMGLVWLLSRASRIVLGVWVRLAALLAHGLLWIASAGLFGHQVARVGKSGIDALPVVVTKISQMYAHWASSARIDAHLHPAHAHPAHHHQDGADQLQANYPSGPTPAESAHDDQSQPGI
jgi:hypothetical protein